MHSVTKAKKSLDTLWVIMSFMLINNLGAV